MTGRHGNARMSEKRSLTLVRQWPVSMTVRFHLFPFRTQKLSSLVPKIVGWRRSVKIGRCRLLFLIWPVGQAVKTAASHAVNVGSIPARVTKKFLILGCGIFLCFRARNRTGRRTAVRKQCPGGALVSPREIPAGSKGSSSLAEVRGIEQGGKAPKGEPQGRCRMPGFFLIFQNFPLTRKQNIAII